MGALGRAVLVETAVWDLLDEWLLAEADPSDIEDFVVGSDASLASVQ